MKKNIPLLLFLSIFFILSINSHASHNRNIKAINMEIFKDGKIIGYSNYFFKHEKNILEVKNYTKFKVKLFNVAVFSVEGETLERYKKNKLIYFKSQTYQNDKIKYVNLYYDEKKNKFIIDGSSFTGKTDIDAIIGNWWNYKILDSNKQISPLSGSVKPQIITFIGEENIELYGKNYLVEHYKLKSVDQNLPKNKKLDFDIWLNPKNNLILKVLYHRLGNWEYRLKTFE